MIYSCSSGAYCHAQANYSFQQYTQPSPLPPGDYSGSIDELVENNLPELQLHHPLYRSTPNADYLHDYYQSPQTSSAYDVTEQFLSSVRPAVQFIDEAAQIQDYIKVTFEQLMHRPFPADIIVKVCDMESMKIIHEKCGGGWQHGIMGFAVNNRPGLSQVFVMQDSLDKVMLVIGHELGHVLSQKLKSSLDEEAKAFAFESAWAKTLKEHNIANLQDSISLNFQPARNGLHNIAFNFVRKHIRQGTDALEIYLRLIDKSLKVNACTL